MQSLGGVFDQEDLRHVRPVQALREPSHHLTRENDFALGPVGPPGPPNGAVRATELPRSVSVGTPDPT